MSRMVDVAVVGATSLIGEAAVEIIGARIPTFSRLFPVATDAESGAARCEFRGRHPRVEQLEEFDFGQVQIALFCENSAVTAQYAPQAVAAGCVVVDGSRVYRDDDQVPLVVPEVNPGAIAGFQSRGVIASPESTTVALVVALKPIYDAVGVERVNVVTLEAVSGSGRAAVEELARQTADLLNARPITTRVFRQQIAFNVLPHVEEMQENGYTECELSLGRETRKVLSDESIMVNVTAIRVPVFYGHSIAMHVETREKIGASHAHALLADAPGVEIVDQRAAGGAPNAVVTAGAGDRVYVGRIREDISHPRGLDLWVVADNVRRGGAWNSVQIADLLAKEYL